MSKRLGGMLAALLSLQSGPAVSGVIHGTVRVPSHATTVASTNPYPGRAGSMPGMHMNPPGQAGDAIVYVERVPARAESALATLRAPIPRLAQREQCFSPRVLAIAVGSAVDFPNMDPIYHNVFSLSPVRRFDLGKYPRGQSRRVVFPKAGLVNVYCDIHSDMEAFILVLPHHGFARPESNGEYQLPELPPGRYLLKAWHPDLGERSETVEFPANGDVTADMEF